MMIVRMKMAGHGKDGGAIRYDCPRECGSTGLTRSRRMVQSLRHQAVFLEAARGPRKAITSVEARPTRLHLGHRIRDLNRHGQ